MSAGDPEFDQNLVNEFRARSGKLDGPYAETLLLLLTTTGARSGELRTTPLIYLLDDNRYIVVAAKGGSPVHPGWYHNIIAEPGVTIEIGGEKLTATGSRAEGAERTRLFDACATQMPWIVEFQEKTERQIPIVVLEPVR